MSVERAIRRADAAVIEAIDVDVVIDKPDERPQWVTDAIAQSTIVLSTDNVPRISIRRSAYAGTALIGDKLCFDGTDIFYVNRRDFLRYFVPRSDEASSE